MTQDPPEKIRHRVIPTAAANGVQRYQLLTSLVVPRPIGWVSTRGKDGTLNIAPFSFFAAISASPMLVSLSIGTRRGIAKDSLQNIRDQGAFCMNVVTERQLDAVNRTAANLPPDRDEFALAGLPVGRAESVEAPYVANCPAVFECRTFKEVDLDGTGSLIIGEVMAVRLDPALPVIEGTAFVDTEALRPVGRLWGPAYTLLGKVQILERP